jgi:hypothetical protein
MFRRIANILILSVLVSAGQLNEGLSAQDTILTIYGDRIITSESIADEAERLIKYKNKKLDIKTLYFDDVFSVTKSDGTIRHFYSFDPARGNGLQVEEMSQNLHGTLLAKDKHNEPLPFILGFAAGFGSIYATPLVKANMLYSPIIPLVYVIGVGITSVNPPKHVLSKTGRPQSEHFYAGYGSKAKSKRMNAAIIGSITGLAAGAGFYAAGLR